MPKMKVFQFKPVAYRLAARNPDGTRGSSQVDMTVAATSMAKAAQAFSGAGFHVSAHYLRGYAYVDERPEERAESRVLLENPGVVYWRPDMSWGEPWAPVPKAES